MPYLPVSNTEQAENVPIAIPGGSIYIDSNQQLVIDGVVVAASRGVDVIGYVDGLIWQKNVENLWYSTPGPNQPYTLYTGPGAPPDLVATFGPGGIDQAVDTELNGYTVTANFQLDNDGVLVPNSKDVIALYAPKTGGIWQENSSNAWFFQATPASPWSAGTYLNPITGMSPSIWKGGGTNNVNIASEWINGGLAAGKGAVLTAGTINVGAGNLDGNVLDIIASTAQNPTIDMSAGSDISFDFSATNDTLGLSPINNTDDLNVSITGAGTSTLNSTYFYLGDVVVSADISSSLMLTQTDPVVESGLLYVSSFTQNGGTFLANPNVGFDVLTGSFMLNSNLAGNGLLNVYDPQTIAGGNTEVTGSIAASSGISAYSGLGRVSFTGGYGFSGVIIDKPTEDLGQVILGGGEFLQLKDLASATSYTASAGKLDIFGQAGKLLANVNVTDSLALSVGQGSNGNVYAYATAGGLAGELATAHITALPVHT